MTKAKDTPTSCPYCDLDDSDALFSSDLVVAVAAPIPDAPGHSLVIPRRHVPTYFEASTWEQSELWRAVAEIKKLLDEIHHPAGYNVGFDVGAVAGQQVMHCHIHIVPRTAAAGDGNHQNKRQPRATSSSTDTGLPRFVPGQEEPLGRVLQKALQTAARFDVVVAYVHPGGLKALEADLLDALKRDVRVRILVGDYQGGTSADALRWLLSLDNDNDGLEAWFFHTETGGPFHPKAYVFHDGSGPDGAGGTAYIGSSNLSGPALGNGIEWNLRLVSSEDVDTFRAVTARVEALLAHPSTKRLTREIIDAYEERFPTLAAPPRRTELRAPPPTPHDVQVEALAALKRTRQEGETRGLVVLATGLGKTLLSAFDFEQMGAKRGLFVAHRDEILGQAKDAWQRVHPDKVLGSYQSTTRERDADILFASIQTLARSRHLSSFAPDHFDYIVVDEFHHATASTYTRLLGHFQPRFMLGLTATPERMDGQSLLALCDDNLVYRRDLLAGVAGGLLVPFHYFGVKDGVDFEPIPWRSGRFEAAALTAAVATSDRAHQALREYEKHAAPGKRRCMCFCVSTAHADFMAAFFRSQGRKAVAIHSQPTSSPRAESMRAFRDGEIEIVCAVDIFNEGVDVPDVNVVLMLRPTESTIVFLQQLGRGLRPATGKTHLTIVDFIGNHRSFLSKPQALMALLGQSHPGGAAVERLANGVELPDGCSIDIETEAIDLLRAMVRTNTTDVVLHEYVTFRSGHARRPTATELFRKNVSLSPVRKNAASWFDYLADQGDLDVDEERILHRHRPFFTDLLNIRVRDIGRFLALRSLLEEDGFFVGMTSDENAKRAVESVKHDLLIVRELRRNSAWKSLTPIFVEAWKAEALTPWSKGEGTSTPWFSFDGEKFRLAFSVADEDRQIFEAMASEMVDLRIAEHRDRLIRNASPTADIAPVVLSVSRRHHRPVLCFSRDLHVDVPEGEVWVDVEGERHLFCFERNLVRVLWAADGRRENVLPALMRGWFGPVWGTPGPRVQLRREDDDWFLDRLPEAPIRMAPHAKMMAAAPMPFFPDVKVACGSMEGELGQGDTMERIAVKASVVIDKTRHFVVRADGNSMNGGSTPIVDGDLVLCEWVKGRSLDGIEGRPHLLVGGDAADTSFAVMKVPRRREGRWLLESWNPDVPPMEMPASGSLQPVARVLEVVHEDLGLELWGTYDRNAIIQAFGSKPDASWKNGYRDLVVDGAPHSVIIVTLRKDNQPSIEYRYDNHFESKDLFAWNSQDKMTSTTAKGSRLVNHQRDGRGVHLFVRYGRHQSFTYLGRIRYRGHQGEAPMHCQLHLETPLPETLYRLWR